MADFIDLEAEIDQEEKDEVSDDYDLESLSSFIDNDENEQDSDATFYWAFDNIETNIDEVLQNECEKGLKELENFNDVSNLCESSEENSEIDDFRQSEQKVKNSLKTCYLKLTKMNIIVL